ncbi:MAG: DUF4416 family protein [Candidatus Omnitrophica bacterium]|nr:DUF4416 family protein [Candidatus Omnitrophota bacterium]
MLDIQIPKPVKFISGFIYSEEKIFNKTIRLMTKKFGRIDFQSKIIPFDFTDYYEKEMGQNLKRRFVSFERLQKPDNFASIKIFCNKLEKKLLKKRSRLINIDPGYINEAKLVLTTTKDYSHRIYLKKGIFAEVTLKYMNGNFIHLDTTFPDYRTKTYKEAFMQVRNIYRNQIKQQASL